MAETRGFGDAKFRESLEKAHSSAEQAGQEIVRLMMDLRPTLLDDLGMAAAIYRYAKDALEPKGINVSMECIGREHRLPTEVEVACFRVAQGLVSNVVQHSRARNVSIRVECSRHKALLRVEDDGSGFDVDKITEIEPGGRGAGLFTMRERLSLVGGTGQIESSPGHGTRITVTVPIVKDLGDLANDQDQSLDRR
jgi:signal transduction histidine kinase